MATSRKSVPAQVRKQIIVMAAQGGKVSEIMKETGQTDATIRKICADAGIELERHPEKMTDERRAEILKLSESGLSAPQITMQTGVPESTVRKIIRKEKKSEPEQLTGKMIQLELTDTPDNKILEALCLMRDCITMLIEAKMA